VDDKEHGDCMDRRDEALGDMVPDNEVRDEEAEDKAYDDYKDRRGEALDDKVPDSEVRDGGDDKACDDCMDRRGEALDDKVPDNEVRDDGKAYDDDMVGDGMVRSLDDKVHGATQLGLDEHEDRGEEEEVHYGLSLVWEIPRLLQVTLHHEPLQKIPGHPERLLIH